MPVFVKNRKTFVAEDGVVVYIGRPSILGNPFTHLKGKTLAKYTVLTRDESISKYKDYFYEQLKTNKQFAYEIERISRLVKEGMNVYLVCWCKPLPCHGDIIKECLDTQNP